MELQLESGRLSSTTEKTRALSFSVQRNQLSRHSLILTGSCMKYDRSSIPDEFVRLFIVAACYLIFVIRYYMIDGSIVILIQFIE